MNAIEKNTQVYRTYIQVEQAKKKKKKKANKKLNVLFLVVNKKSYRGKLIV